MADASIDHVVYEKAKKKINEAAQINTVSFRGAMLDVQLTAEALAPGDKVQWEDKKGTKWSYKIPPTLKDFHTLTVTRLQRDGVSDQRGWGYTRVTRAWALKHACKTGLGVGQGSLLPMQQSHRSLAHIRVFPHARRLRGTKGNHGKGK